MPSRSAAALPISAMFSPRGSLHLIGAMLWNLVRRPSAFRPERHPGRGHVGTAEIEVVRVDAVLRQLPVELEGGGHVAQRTERQALHAHGRHDVGPAAGSPKLGRLLLQERLQALDRVEVHDRHVRTQELHQEQVALEPRTLLAVQEDDRDLQPQLARGGRHLPAPVALGVGAGHHRVAALAQDVGEDELELPGLVAAHREAGEVVALDPDLGAAQRRRQTLAALQRCRECRQPHPRES